jgi:hypothetical protein
MLNNLFRALEREFIGNYKDLRPVKDTFYYGKISDAEVEAMRMRNEEAIQKRIEELGTKWLLHPQNKIERLEK